MRSNYHVKMFKSVVVKEPHPYIFLVLVADRQGMSYYSYDKICSLICVSLDEYI